VGKYRKQRLGHEAERNLAGAESPVFETLHGSLGLFICADRTDPEIARKLRAGGAELLICPSGGMFGPEHNDPIVQARSRENQLPIVFVHPAEFLVTGPDGSILDRVLLGDKLLVPADQIGGDEDASGVFYFDLPTLPKSTADASPPRRRACPKRMGAPRWRRPSTRR
jgi:predicted amidohydrolase